MAGDQATDRRDMSSNRPHRLPTFLQSPAAGEKRSPRGSRGLPHGGDVRYAGALIPTQYVSILEDPAAAGYNGTRILLWAPERMKAGFVSSSPANLGGSKGGQRLTSSERILFAQTSRCWPPLARLWLLSARAESNPPEAPEWGTLSSSTL